MHILYADDSKATSLPTIEYLRRQGHRITFVQDGRAAVDAYRIEPPDLVLMDIVMPQMDGIEATRHIKKLGGARWIPVMLMTALSDKNEIIAGLDAGADEYLIKPIIHEVLEARIRSMQRITTMQDSLAGILDNVFEAIITIDEHGTVRSFNLAAETIFGYGPGEVIGNNVRMLMPAPYADEHNGYLERYLRERTPRIIGIGRKVRGRRKDGEIFPMRLAVTEVQRNNSSLFIGLVSDISTEEAARARIEFLALHDPLTGLPNRAHLGDVLGNLLKHAATSSHAVLLIDLDGFKPINDTLGHEAGDEALKAVAARLRNSLAAGDFVARLGGDEFVVIARDVVNANAALRIGMRLVETTSQPLALAGTSVQLGASIGVALVPAHGLTASRLLTMADSAMYQAKREGKGRVVIAGSGDE